jgi:hypothetical protein
MPLHYRLDKIEGYATVCYVGEGEDLHPITESLIWLGNAGGYFTITERNADEVFWRVSILAELWGAPAMTGDGKPWFITEEDVRKHIGLSTNWPPKTKTVFDMEVKLGRAKQVSQ